MAFLDSDSPLLIKNFASERYIYAEENQYWSRGVGASTTITPTRKWIFIQKTYNNNDTFYIKNAQSGNRCIYAQSHRTGLSGVGAGRCQYGDNNWIVESTNC